MLVKIWEGEYKSHYLPVSKLYSVQPPSIDLSFDRLELNVAHSQSIPFDILVFPKKIRFSCHLNDILPHKLCFRNWIHSEIPNISQLTRSNKSP